MTTPRCARVFQFAFWLTLSALASAPPGDGGLAWPPVSSETRPWSYWWWMGSAVDSTNLTRELERYHDAGWGGLHIIPIYGAKGWEGRYIDYLSPQWMRMLCHTTSEARRLGMGIDMTLGTGWCFGGPHVTPLEANASVISKVYELKAGQRIEGVFDRAGIQALAAFAPDGTSVDLTARLGNEGSLDWVAPDDRWRVYAISQRPSGQKVKRAAPGGAGHMLNLFYLPAMNNYLRVFSEGFAGFEGPFPRAMYHDSYEYNSNWSPDLFEEFARRRGYRLQDELPALLGKEPSERAARVKCDYRETLSDIMAEETLPAWVRWSHEHGMVTRNEAHGSPGNLLDLYAVADIPETEMFHLDRNKLVSKLASSAAHVLGRRLVAAETGTWLKEHFTETLADMKYLQDDLFLSGVNHILYHGSCYSPDEAPWPGWLFYASYEMNPRNSIWRDVPALNEYATRCQSVLQSGSPDNDLLLYWPIHDYWQQPEGLEKKLTVHARQWLEDQPFGKAAQRLWNRGYAFDYISDRQLATAEVRSGAVVVPGGRYRAIAVPACDHMPLKTIEQLFSLAKRGATVIFEDHLPADVPGWGALGQRRSALKKLLQPIVLTSIPGTPVRQAKAIGDHLLVGDLDPGLVVAGIPRERLVDFEGLMFLRRRFEGGRHYFIANRGERAFNGWLALSTSAQSTAIMDPMSGRVGVAPSRPGPSDTTEVLLQLEPGESIIVRAFDSQRVSGPDWPLYEEAGTASEVSGVWQIQFIAGGPQLPPPIQATNLLSWTQLGGEDAQRFAGTARYSLTFDAPSTTAKAWRLDLGRVCQSAKVRLNGTELATRFVPPFRVTIPTLKAKANLLEVEVTGISANRIRDLDRRKVPWKNFHDINFVNLDYKPFDASNWPLADCGLIGPVTLCPLDLLDPERH